MRFLKAFGRFWYDFVIGDDWKIAAAVVLALGVSLAALELHLLGDAGVAVLGGLAVMAFFSVSLAVDVRTAERRKPAAAHHRSRLDDRRRTRISTGGSAV